MIRYEDFTAGPAATVRDLYDRFGFTMDPGYEGALAEEERSIRSYRSGHRYAIEDHGQTRREIVDDLGPVFERYGFDTRDPEKGGEDPETGSA